MAKFDDENCLKRNVPPKKFLQNIIKRLKWYIFSTSATQIDNGEATERENR